MNPGNAAKLPDRDIGVILLCVSGILLSSCSTPSAPRTTRLNAQSIQGTWYYADVRKAYNPVFPPKFDIMEFGKEGRLKVTSSLKKWSFDGSFRVVGDELTLSIQVPEKTTPSELKLKFDTAYGGRGLVVMTPGAESVFYRSHTFLHEDIAGSWVAQAEGQTLTMVLGKDGSYLLKESNAAGFYRLWDSQYGKTMTAVVSIEGEGGFTFFSLYERNADQLILFPQSEKGFQKESALTFRLVK